jgi:APA family basic amino acid/polyamine antiporter
MQLFRRKSIDALIAEGSDEAHGLKRTLTVFDLIAFGVGCVVGAGIFAVLGAASSGSEGVPPAGPGVTVSILLTALACGFCALCYAEFASLVPVAGSAYTYSYATLGELIAWMIGWDLIIEYAVSNIAVAISWAAYFRQVLLGFGFGLPSWIASDYRSGLLAAKAVAESGVNSLGPESAIAYDAYLHHPVVLGIPIVFNVLAVGITALLTWLLVRGVKESARFNNGIVVLKICAILFFIVIGAHFVKPANWHPFFPAGVRGVWTGASLIFFAYVGFDAVSTTAEECKNPARDLPRGIIGSLIICTLLYALSAIVLTGMVPFAKLRGVADPLAAALHYVQQDWAAGLIAYAAVIAMTAVLLVTQLGQARILMAMSRDGLLGRWFGKIHPRFKTPHISTILTGIFVAFFSALANINEVVQLVNIGTLFAFVLVCIGIVVMRHREPDRPRRFRVPLVPLVPALGIVCCGALMAGLPRITWIWFGMWLSFGLVIYFLYGKSHSRLNPAPSTPVQSAEQLNRK